MEVLELPHNYNNKLFNHTFGVVLPHAPYTNAVGNIVKITCKSIAMGTGRIVAVRVFPFSKINDALSFLEIGKAAPYLAEIMKRYHGVKATNDALLDHVIVQYEERNMPVHQQLLMDWWQGLVADDETVNPNF